MIQIKKLNKIFEDFHVLKDVDVNIPKGMIYGLIGRSGAGKSTLLRCINGLVGYDSGSLYVDGVDVKALGERELREFRKDIGMIFQQFSLLARLSVYENIALPLRSWKYDNNHIDKKVKELLEVVGIPDKIKALPRELSGGQKQRVAIARALAMNPKILLCDEVTSALDPKTAKSIINLLNKINKELGKTIVIVTHQMSVLRATCQEITILEEGKVAAQGSVEEIFLQQPEALKNLIGQKEYTLPADGLTMKVLLASKHRNMPIITQMARDLDIDFSILGGEMNSYRDKFMGAVMINVADEDAEKVRKYLINNQVIWEELSKQSAEVESMEEEVENV